MSITIEKEKIQTTIFGYRGFAESRQLLAKNLSPE
jgi:hypothetical protein